MSAFLNWCLDNIGITIVVILAIFEITPIKFHPLKWFLKWIGNNINSELLKTVNELKHKVSDQERTIDINEMDRIRWDILDFANTCRNGRLHTKDEFEHVVRQEEKYRELLKKTKTTNGVFEEEYKFVKELYRESIRDNTFLK